MGKKKKTLYELALISISDIEVGGKKEIKVPDKLPAFRKYLNEISSRQGKKFTTKVIDKKLHIMRVEYTNIYL